VAGSCGWVEFQVAQELAGGGIDDVDVAVGGQEQDVGSGVGSSDADVVKAAVIAPGHGAAGAHDIVADAVVGVCGPVAGVAW